MIGSDTRTRLSKVLSISLAVALVALAGAAAGLEGAATEAGQLGSGAGTGAAVGTVDGPAVPMDLVVRETAGIARSGEVLQSGVALARGRNATDPAAMAILDPGGRPVPADFRVLARWNAGLAAMTAPIQWIQVIFAADVPADGAVTYRLVTDGSVTNPTPATALRYSDDNGVLTVDTGAAEFVIDTAAASLFERASNSLGEAVIVGGDMSTRRDGVDGTRDALRSYRIEYAGPLSLSVVVSGSYSQPAVAGGLVAEQRRYVFTAGSPTAEIRHGVQWEGDACGDGVTFCDGSPNAVLVDRVRDGLDLAVGADGIVEVHGALDAPPLTGPDSAPATVAQELRGDRTQALRSTVSAGGTTQDQGAVDGALVLVSGSAGGVAASLDRPNRYEPQAITYADGVLSILPIADTAWLGARQGTWARMTVSALDPGTTLVDARASTWARLNHPLRAWPDAGSWQASEAVEPLAPSELPAEYADYDAAVEGMLDQTMTSLDDKGLTNVMTFGSFPRFWDSGLYGDEIDCGGDDPTPGDDWDDPYWCATWSDYHNGMSLAVTQAMRTGEVEWLDDLATPGALRMLYTQVLRCAPDDANFYCGQAPTGYGGFRENWNGSHAYFDNLIQYYWLTGDSTVVEELERGARTMQGFLCERRPADPCEPTDPQGDPWAFVGGRTGMQWEYTFRFLGLASDDVTFLEDWNANLSVAVNRHYAQLSRDGTSYGIWSDQVVEDEPQPFSDQLWMASLYDMRMLHRLMVDTGDAPIGSPAVRPSEILSGWARTLVDFGSTIEGDGTANGDWPNALFFDYSGPRIGGTLTSVTADLGGGDPYLYDTGKAALAAVLAQAGELTGDADLTAMAGDLVALAIAASIDDGGPISKVQAEYLHRIGPALAVLVDDSSTPPPTTTSTVTTAPPPTSLTTTTTTSSPGTTTIPTATSVSVPPPPGPTRFTDVGLSHRFYDDIEWMAEEGIATGYSDGSFGPVRPVTRQAAMAFLWRLAGSPIAAGDAGFTDVSVDHPFADAIAWGRFNGLTNGFEDNTFRPGQPVTRQAFAAFLWRMSGYPDPGGDPGFGDVGAAQPFASAIWWVANRGISTGYTDGDFRPLGTTTRQAGAAFIHRYAT